MIKSKFSPDEVVHWLSYREIIRRNYFTGDTSLPCLLAHTVCHEFAHLIQQLSGWHKRGSIHNSGYYQILDQLHKSGLAETIKNDIVRECEAQNLELIANIQPAIVTKKTQIEVFFSVNDTVCFDYKNKTHSGTVIKVNRKTLIIRVKNLFRHSRWKVPKLLVRNSS
ncbi:MAG: hypothetical protein OEY36_07355 [Gammaproteobacteria bacterium]|nr:hypothetical protein [Gammaproteobacteria bacterium]